MPKRRCTTSLGDVVCFHLFYLSYITSNYFLDTWYYVIAKKKLKSISDYNLVAIYVFVQLKERQFASASLRRAERES